MEGGKKKRREGASKEASKEQGNELRRGSGAKATTRSRAGSEKR
jgi:hypothetical protein